MTKRKQKPKKTESDLKTQSPTSDPFTSTEDSNCDACTFVTKEPLHENWFCGRHSEFLKTLLRKNIITIDAMICAKFVPKMR